jgi:hypothetical protein
LRSSPLASTFQSWGCQHRSCPPDGAVDVPSRCCRRRRWPGGPCRGARSVPSRWACCRCARTRGAEPPSSWTLRLLADPDVFGEACVGGCSRVDEGTARAGYSVVLGHGRGRCGDGAVSRRRRFRHGSGRKAGCARRPSHAAGRAGRGERGEEQMRWSSAAEQLP